MSFERPALLIFDLDGTLLDSVPDLAESVNFALKTNNLEPCTLEEIRSFVGNGSYKLCERAIKDTKDPAILTQVHDDFLAHYRANVCVKSVAYAGVNEGLTTLKNQGFKLAICTNKPSEFLPDIFRHCGWEFDCIVGGDSLPNKKPDPSGIWHICQTLGIKPSATVMIGDSKNDIQAGQNAGVRTLALSYGYNYDEPIAASSPDQVFDTFDALVAFLCQ